VETLRTVTFDPKWMPNLKEAMINVVDDGTATIVHRDDMKIAAKTGTAQVGSKEHRRQIAWLSGYLPADNPQYSFSVMVEGQFSDNRDDTETGGLLGGVEAGAICKDIFDQMYPVPGKNDKGTPTASSQAGAPTETASADDTTATAPPKADAPAAPDTTASTPTAPAAAAPATP
jgi:penicillin-binding protein 2